MPAVDLHGHHRVQWEWRTQRPESDAATFTSHEQQKRLEEQDAKLQQQQPALTVSSYGGWLPLPLRRAEEGDGAERNKWESRERKRGQGKALS
ncbi:hypothetical protein ZWY2020_030914 [Hordeum vulgare]|nr:hypothetical protein ZWY2020_030914 [Hordeum vulgare]